MSDGPGLVASVASPGHLYCSKKNDNMQAAMERLEEHASAGLSGTAAKKSTKHVPLLKRATEPALEERLLRFRPAAGMHGGQSSAACEPVRASPVAVLSTPMHDV